MSPTAVGAPPIQGTSVFASPGRPPHAMGDATPELEKLSIDRPTLNKRTREAGAGGQIFKGPWGVSVSRNLTPHPTGLKDFTDAQIIQSVRECVDRSDQPYMPPMGFAFYKTISDADMAALIAYLRSLKPQTIAGK